MKTRFPAAILPARHARTAAALGVCAAALLTAAVCGGFSGVFDHRVKTADALAGKWSGDIPWNSASGRDYSHTMHTALFFLPGGVTGTVMTFPTGAVGGSGTYTLKDGRLTIRCTGMSVTGHAVPLSLFAKDAWFHDTATYTVASDGATLTLTPAPAGPSSAPCYPLLLSSKPLVFSRVERPAQTEAVPAPKE